MRENSKSKAQTKAGTVKASDPVISGGKRHGTRCAPGELAEYVLLPGDPGRIDLIASLWDDSTEVAHNRSWRAITGRYLDVRISAMSTGVGGPSAEVALVDLAKLGTKTAIRVGTTGCLQEHIALGDLIINTACVRYDGTSDQYIDPAFPAVAHYEAVLALITACEKLGYRYHLGIAATAASFFAGQGRVSAAQYLPRRGETLVEDLQRAGVTNLEMEGATIMTLSSLFNIRAGMICAVVADRVRDQWSMEHGQKEACEAASLALTTLAKWDQAKEAAGKRHFYPELGFS